MLKTEIVSELGENPLLLPTYVEQALQANDRVKYFFTVLQEARRCADHPETGATDLRAERTAAGIMEQDLDAIVPNAQRSKTGKYYIPLISLLHKYIVTAIQNMLTPVRVAFGKKEYAQYEKRLNELLACAPDFTGDEVGADYIHMATHGQRHSSDSLHLLVMDLHKLINKLQAELSKESLDGAKAYSIIENDRPLIRAFMSGLNMTAPLKFDHPGLATTATRSGKRLIIENDIGTTDVHVLVIHVEGLKVTLTYTDIHERRATFFESLFESYNVEWQDTLSRGMGEEKDQKHYFLCLGTFSAGDEEQLADYLHFLGSRIVFLIDWNKARKRLRNFIKKSDCIALLKWAADNNFGHRGFLQVGGERLVYEALAQVSRAEYHYGDRLDELLGREHAIELLKYVLQTASQGLMNGRSERLIRDEIKTEMFNYFKSAGESIYELCADHAANIYDLANAVSNTLTRDAGIIPGEQTARMAVLAKRWETRADDQLNRLREVARRTGSGQEIRELTEQADDVADSLEEAAYLITLLPDKPVDTDVTRQLQNLSILLVDGICGYIRCIENARQLEESNIREDRQDFLEAVDDIITIEHQTDAEERRLLKLLLQQDSPVIQTGTGIRGSC